jgi:hypothetical protein
MIASEMPAAISPYSMAVAPDSSAKELCKGDLLGWAKACLSLKNTLQEEDARTIEAAYQKRLEQDALPHLI